MPEKYSCNNDYVGSYSRHTVHEGSDDGPKATPYSLMDDLVRTSNEFYDRKSHITAREVLEAVEGMTDSQRRRLASLLGVGSETGDLSGLIVFPTRKEVRKYGVRVPDGPHKAMDIDFSFIRTDFGVSSLRNFYSEWNARNLPDRFVYNLRDTYLKADRLP